MASSKKNNQSTFPLKSSSLFQILTSLYPVTQKYIKRKSSIDFGSLDTPALTTAKLVNQLFSLWNLNHLGNWSHPKTHPWASKQLEKETISAMADLYQSNLKTVGGYVTSGGSESNLFLMWISRQYHQQHNNTNIVCLVSDLTHYSVAKSARIVSLQVSTIALDKDSWSMHPQALQATLTSLYSQGTRGFTLVFTLGYSTTGTCDQLDELTTVLREFKQLHADVSIFTWIDAALNGLIEPFLNKQFAPFKNPLIQGIVVDFHKFGGVLPTAGVVLYRQHLKRLIESPINYLDHSDATLLGGRSGNPAVNIWSVIHRLGYEGLQQRVDLCMKLKAYYLAQLTKINIDYVTHPRSLTVGLLISKDHRLSAQLESDFSVYHSTLSLRFWQKKAPKSVDLYKTFVLPHLSRQSIDAFITALSKPSRVNPKHI